MPKKKESWKEKRRRAALKRERALEAERIRREREPKKKRKGWSRGKVFGALFLISLCLISYGLWQYTQPPTQSSSPEPPSPQPPSPEEPSLYTLTNTDFSEFRGKVVVLDFFATWCSPCIQQIPQLAEIHGKYNSSDVVVISIGSSSDTAEDLEQFKEEHDMSWRVARDTVGAFGKYDVQYIPKLVILDQEGSISYEHESVTSASDLANVIDSLLSP